MHSVYQKIRPRAPHLFYGADYNPDQWQDSPEILERDIELMKEAGVTSASVGIFSWTALEPEEGTYRFGWLDRVMDRFAEEGMFVFLATPSGSKPMWMSEKYPEIRRVGKDGIREESGWRHNHCLSSPIYREKTAAINRRLAERYRDHPALALWHVGNEFGGECHCDLCRAAFHQWLRERYENLDALNHTWWTAFWSHTFTDWAQIPTQDPSIDGLQLDWIRFVNDRHLSFIQNEIAPLREITPEVRCTTNFMGTCDISDYWRWAEVVDVVANDHYPRHADLADTWRDSIRSDFVHALMRGMNGGEPWMLLECSPSSTNWGRINKLKRPGVHRQEVLQAVANGASTIHYFQWRKGRGGMEKYHGAVVDHEGSNRSRVFRECATVGADLQELAPLAEQACPRAEVAMVFDWESRWALNASPGPKVLPGRDPFPGDLYTETCFDHHEALTRAGLPVDVVSVNADFSAYKVLVLPALYLVTEDTARRIRAFVEAGGHVVATCLTGYVGPSNLCHLGGFPGAGLREVFGIWNEELDNLHDATRIEVDGIVKGTVLDVIERIHLEGAASLARATSDVHAGASVIAAHSFGKGSAAYLAARFEMPVLLGFYKHLIRERGLRRSLEIDLPEAVIYRRRRSRDGSVGFLFNYAREPRTVDLQGHRFVSFSEPSQVYEGLVELRPYESLVLKEPT